MHPYLIQRVYIRINISNPEPNPTIQLLNCEPAQSMFQLFERFYRNFVLVRFERIKTVFTSLGDLILLFLLISLANASTRFERLEIEC